MKDYFIIRVDSIIDIITNSSSELFVIENTMAKSALVELVNAALNGSSKITEFCLDDRFAKDKRNDDWEIENILENFPESDREILKLKYFTDPKWYALAFDRDWIYTMERDRGVNIREILHNIGFELIDTDY